MSRQESREMVEERLGELLSTGLSVSTRELGVSLRVHSVRRQPPGEDKTFVTFTAKVGYALPDDARNRTRLEAGQSSTNAIPVEISINDPIGADESVALEGGRFLRVGFLEDIAAEKLRALLQQRIRNRRRPQDLLDVAHILRRERPLDLRLVSDFLLEKAEARNVPVSKAAFHAPEIAERAGYGYEELRDTVRRDYILFEDALELLFELVSQLDIPEE